MKETRQHDYASLMKQANTLQNQGKGAAAAARFAEAETAAGDDTGPDTLIKKGQAAQGEGVAKKIEDDFAGAMQAHARALDYYRQAGSKLHAGRALRDMGIAAGDHNEPHRALDYLEQSITTLGDLYAAEPSEAVSAELGISYAKRGLYYLAQGQLQLAEQDLTSGLELTRSDKHRFYEMTTLLHLADLRHHQGNHDAALQLLDDAEEIVENDLGGRDQQSRRLAEIEACRARCLLAQDDREGAARAYQASMELMQGMTPEARQLVVRKLGLDKTGEALGL